MPAFVLLYVGYELEHFGCQRAGPVSLPAEQIDRYASDDCGACLGWTGRQGDVPGVEAPSLLLARQTLEKTCRYVPKPVVAGHIERAVQTTGQVPGIDVLIEVARTVTSTGLRDMLNGMPSGPPNWIPNGLYSWSAGMTDAAKKLAAAGECDPKPSGSGAAWLADLRFVNTANIRAVN